MAESLDKMREQFDNAPYPRIPLERSPKQDYNELFIHNLITSFYLKNRRVVAPQGKVILDAGCGSGYKSLILAEANPGARIVGVDLSEESVKLARLRLQHHGFENAEFHAMLIEDLPTLGLTFDYINCDEVLYLLPDPLAGLQAMQSVLKAGGILRGNLHSAFQREPFYRAQALFRLVGLMDQNPREREIAIVQETMQALKGSTFLKQQAWRPEYEGPDAEPTLLANHLLLGDKGFTIPQMFELLDGANLEFVSMVNWRFWEVPDLFKDPDNMPALWGFSLLEAEPRDRLQLYELLNPLNRLMDFWCARAGAEEPELPVVDWQADDWQGAIAHLHPQLRHEFAESELIHCIQNAQPFEFNPYVDLPTMGPVRLIGIEAACLLPLWEGPQPVATLAERYQQICPVDPVTLTPISPAEAFEQVCAILNRLEAFLYVLLERHA